MPNIFSGLGQGLGAIGAGVSRGELAGTQFEYKARQQKALQDYKNSLLALQGDKIKSASDIAAERINEQQRQLFGRKAMMLGRALTDTTRQADFNSQPGLRREMENEYNDSIAVATGQLDWRHVAPSKFVDPVTGEVRLPPGGAAPSTGANAGLGASGAPTGVSAGLGASGAPTGATPGLGASGPALGTPWKPEPGQPLSENPYLSTKDRAAQQRVETGQAAQTATETYQRGQLDIGRGHLAIAGTKANAGLAEQTFRDNLDLAKAKLTQANTTFDQQMKIWGDVYRVAAQTAKAGGDPAKDLKPFLFSHGMMGLQVPNDAVIRDFLARNGEDEATIQKVIQGNPLHGAGRSTMTTPPAGAQGAQPAGAVMGSWQSSGNEPRQLPSAAGFDLASLPGGGPPTPAQMASATMAAPGGLGVAPINLGGAGGAAAGPRGNVNATARGMGINTPATAPKLRSPYPQGTVEDEVFGALTGRNGAPIPAKTILQNFQGTPYFRKVADVINRTNSSQQEGLFAGMPVAGTNGAEWPNVPGFEAGQVQIPGAAVFSPSGSTPVVNQSGFAGTPRPGAAQPALPVQPPPDMGPGGEVTLAPQSGTPLGPQQPMPGMPSPQIDLGPWNQGPTRNSADQKIGSIPYGDRQMKPDQNVGPVPKSERGFSWGTGDTRLSKIMEALMGHGAGPEMVARIPGGAGSAGALPPPPVEHPNPGLMATGDPATQQELQQLRGMPWAPAVEKFLKVNNITDPGWQRDYYRWVTQQLVPRILNLPKMTKAQVLSMLFPIMQKYARPQ